ncbi:MAG: hypothetical protein J6Y36_06480, partial [Treponema sp.]|nr:hypothetical protein [Treponema sp.]
LKILLFLFLSILAVSCKPHRKTYGSVEAKNVLYTDHTEDFPVVFNNTVINKKDIDKLIGYHRKLYRNYLVCPHQVYCDKAKNKAWIAAYNMRKTDYVFYEISDEADFPETRIVKSFDQKVLIPFITNDNALILLLKDKKRLFQNLYTDMVEDGVEFGKWNFSEKYFIKNNVLTNRFTGETKDVSRLEDFFYKSWHVLISDDGNFLVFELDTFLGCKMMIYDLSKDELINPGITVKYFINGDKFEISDKYCITNEGLYFSDEKEFGILFLNRSSERKWYFYDFKDRSIKDVVFKFDSDYIRLNPETLWGKN